MSNTSLRRQALYTALLFSLLLLLVPRAGYVNDVNYWVNWAIYIQKNGLSNIYQLPDNNYNPLYHYILWLFGKLAGSPGRIALYRHWLKGFTLLFDFGGAIWAASLVPGARSRRFELSLLLLLNFAYLYNTLIWEQVDAIYTFFAFGAVVLAVQQRTVSSLCLYVLALMAKTQAIIFLPPLLLLWVPQWWQRPGRLLQAGLAGAALALLIVAPFVWGGAQNGLPRIIEINRNSVNFNPFVSMNAYNFWQLLVAGPTTTSDLTVFAGLSYHNWGLLLFSGFSGLALWPLLRRGLRQLRRPMMAEPEPPAATVSEDFSVVLLSCGLIPVLFCFFNTQMHERYWHAALLFLAAYGFVRRDYLLYIMVSVGYFLNLEDLLHHLRPFRHNSIFFKAWFVATLFGLVIIIALIKLYRLAWWRAASAVIEVEIRPAANAGL